MSEEVERYAVRKVLENQTEMIKNLMESMEWTEEQAMTALKFSDKDKVTLQKGSVSMKNGDSSLFCVGKENLNAGNL